MKKTIVVGGSSGIGLALCQRLRGMDVGTINISRTPCPVAGVVNLIADVTRSDELEKAFTQTEYADALVYCAGTSIAAPVRYAEMSDVKELVDVNFIGAVECCKLALPILERSKNGRIILLGSSGGVAPIAFDSFYSASKAALSMFASALDLETDVKCVTAVIDGTRTRFSFKRNVYRDCGDYDRDLERATDALIKIEQTGCDASFVADGIVKILCAKNPPPVVTVGIKNKLKLSLYKILPQRLKQAVLRRVYRMK